MNDLDQQIITLLSSIYELGEEDTKEVLSVIENLHEEQKKNIITALFHRRETMTDNIQRLLQWLDLANNQVEESIEKHAQNDPTPYL